MLLGSEIGAALTALEPLGIDLIGLNCATGPAEMSEHLRYLSRHARIAAVRACPTPACRELGPNGAYYPLTPGRAGRRALTTFVREYGARRWSAAAAAPRPSTCARSSRRCARSRRRRAQPAPRGRRRPRSTSRCRSGRTPAYLTIGERTNANGSKAFREAMLEGRWDDCVEIAREPDPRRRAPARPVRRLRRPRRRRRHARDRRPVRHRLDPADRARLHRAAGDRGRAWRCSAAAR